MEQPTQADRSDGTILELPGHPCTMHFNYTYVSIYKPGVLPHAVPALAG